MLAIEPMKPHGAPISRTTPATIVPKFSDLAALEAWLADPGDGDGAAGVLIRYDESDVDRPIRLDVSAGREVLAESPGTTAWQLYAVSRMDCGGGDESSRTVYLERLGVGTFTHVDDGGIVFSAAEAGDPDGSGFRTPTVAVVTTDDGVAEARNGRALQAVTSPVGPAAVAAYDVGPYLGVVLLLACEGTDTVRALARRWA